MKGTILIYPASDPGVRTVNEYTVPPTLTDLQTAVGGYIEAVPRFSTFEDNDGDPRRCVVWCNEEGKLQNLPINQRMTAAWVRSLRRQGLKGPIGDYLVGPIAVCFGDDEFMNSL